MSIPVTHPIAILNVLELVLSIIISGLMSEVGCMTGMKIQYVAGIVYGYLIIHIILVAAIFLSQNIDKHVRLLISGPGSILYLAAAALMLEGGDQVCVTPLFGTIYDQIIAAGVLGLASCISMAVECFFIWRHFPDSS